MHPKLLTKTMSAIAMVFTVVLVVFGFQIPHNKPLFSVFYHPDFFINYQAGFIRRGLDGELIFRLSKLFSQSPLLIQEWYNLLAFVLFLSVLGILLIKKRPPFYVIFSLSIFILYAIYWDRGIRKDHVILLLFFAIMVYIQKEHALLKQLIVVNFLMITGILMHEILFIIAFFPIVLCYVEQANFQIKKALPKLLILIPSAVIFMLVSFVFPGNAAQERYILQSWSSFPELSGLYFSEGIMGPPLYFWKMGLTSMQILAFFLLLFAHFLFVGMGICNSLKTTAQKKRFATVFVLQYGVIVLLSMFAVDYSRWVFMGNLTAVASVYLYQEKLPQHHQPNPLLDQIFGGIRKLYFVPFVLYFVITMPHSGWSGMDSIVKFNPINLVSKVIVGKRLF